jgi:hypothetical protein
VTARIVLPFDQGATCALTVLYTVTTANVDDGFINNTGKASDQTPDRADENSAGGPVPDVDQRSMSESGWMQTGARTSVPVTRCNYIITATNEERPTLTNM